MMNHFGSLSPLDHPYMQFPLSHGGGILHLPCGTLPTALEEGESGLTTTILIGIPGSDFVRWTVKMSAAEVQATFRKGSLCLNRISEGPRPLDLVVDDD